METAASTEKTAAAEKAAAPREERTEAQKEAAIEKTMARRDAWGQNAQVWSAYVLATKQKCKVV